MSPCTWDAHMANTHQAFGIVLHGEKKTRNCFPCEEPSSHREKSYRLAPGDAITPFPMSLASGRGFAVQSPEFCPEKEGCWDGSHAAVLQMRAPFWGADGVQ